MGEGLSIRSADSPLLRLLPVCRGNSFPTATETRGSQLSRSNFLRVRLRSSINLLHLFSSTESEMISDQVGRFRRALHPRRAFCRISGSNIQCCLDLGKDCLRD